MMATGLPAAIRYICNSAECARLLMKLKILFALFVLACVSPSPETHGRKITTRHKAARNKNTHAASLRTIDRTMPVAFALYDETLSFHGYDKPASAARESFFVTNNSGQSIGVIEIEVSYHATDGSLLHRRKEKMTIPIPSGETRKIEIATWDSAGSFRYYKSKEGKKAATPYTVAVRLLSVSIYQS